MSQTNSVAEKAMQQITRRSALKTIGYGALGLGALRYLNTPLLAATGPARCRRS